MKKLMLLASVVVAGFSAMAQQKADEVVKISAERYDFGKIKQGTPVSTFFTITNTSNKPISIESATAGCGCTTPEYSKEPVAPGATTKLKVGYNAAAMGHFDKDVTIKISGTVDYKTVKITGDVESAPAPAAAAPAASASVPVAVPAGTQVEKVTEVKSATDAKAVKKSKKAKAAKK